MSRIRAQLNAGGVRLYDEIAALDALPLLDPLGRYGTLLFSDRAEDLKFRSFIHEAARRVGLPVGFPGWSRWSQRQAVAAANDQAIQERASELVALWAAPEPGRNEARRFAYEQVRRTNWKSMCFGAILAGIFLCVASFIIGPNSELMFRIVGLVATVVGCLPFGVMAIARRHQRSAG